MALLARIHQKIFGSTGGTGEFGAFGSDSLGAAQTTKNLETIQSLAPYLQGLFAATNNANEPPRIQDINGLYLLFTSQLAYYFQNGIPEWHASTEYYAVVSYCQKGGVIYRSVTNANVNHDPATDDGTNWEAGEASLRQLKWDLDTLGFTGYALYTDMYLTSKKEKARSKSVGEMIYTDCELTPTAFAAAKSTLHPEYPEYCPLIPRHDANHDITTTEVPQWVIDELNATKFKFGSTTDFSLTLASGVITVPAGDDGTKLLQGINQMTLVNRWYGSNELATFEALGGLFTGARAYCCTIGGVNYEISAINVISRTISLATTPANGSYTVTFHPHRIAGYTDRARLRKLSGEAPVVAGDFDGLYAIGGTALDGFQIHWHETYIPTNGSSVMLNGTLTASNTLIGAKTALDQARNPSTPTGEGAPRTGKTTKTRAHAVAAYTHLRSLLATTWTSA